MTATPMCPDECCEEGVRRWCGVPLDGSWVRYGPVRCLKEDGHEGSHGFFWAGENTHPANDERADVLCPQCGLAHTFYRLDRANPIGVICSDPKCRHQWTIPAQEADPEKAYSPTTSAKMGLT